MKIKRGKEGKIKKLRNRVPTVVLSGSDFFFCKWDIYVIGCIDFGPVCLYQTDVLFSLSNASMEKRFVTFSHNLCHEKSDLIKILTQFPDFFYDSIFFIFILLHFISNLDIDIDAF